MRKYDLLFLIVWIEVITQAVLKMDIKRKKPETKEGTESNTPKLSAKMSHIFHCAFTTRSFIWLY